MATFDHPSDLVQCIAYPVPTPGMRIGSRIVMVPAEKKKQVPTSVQDIENGGLFADTLIVSDSKLRSRNPWAVAGSLMIQSLLVATLIIAPLYLTDTLPTRRETLTFLYAPPPPAAASKATRFLAPTPTPTYTSTKTSITAPTHKTPEVSPTPAGAVGGVVGGVPGGIVGGIPGGVLSGILGSTRGTPVAKAPEPAPKRVRLAPRIVEANLIHDVPPTYPPEAGRARIEGAVVLRAVIGKDGTVQDVRVESGLPILAQAAIDAVKQWRYRPYLLNGEPVEVDSRITINFTLTRG
jgi:periplasmic protein TonB